MAPEASVGAKVDVETKTSLLDRFEAANNIIFAYQLLRIKPKGWGKNQTLQTEDFHHKEAFLGDGDEEEEEGEIEMETDAATVDDVAKIQQGVTVVDLDDHQYAWLFQSD